MAGPALASVSVRHHYTYEIRVLGVRCCDHYILWPDSHCCRDCPLDWTGIKILESSSHQGTSLASPCASRSPDSLTKSLITSKWGLKELKGLTKSERRQDKRVDTDKQQNAVSKGGQLHQTVVQWRQLDCLYHHVVYFLRYFIWIFSYLFFIYLNCKSLKFSVLFHPKLTSYMYSTVNFSSYVRRRAHQGRREARG